QWQAYAVSSESRHPSFRATTRVIKDEKNWVVLKRGNPNSSGVFQFEPIMDSPMFEGHSGSAALLYAFRSGDLRQFLTLLKLHAQYLTREFGFSAGEVYP